MGKGESPRLFAWCQDHEGTVSFKKTNRFKVECGFILVDKILQIIIVIMNVGGRPDSPVGSYSTNYSFLSVGSSLPVSNNVRQRKRAGNVEKIQGNLYSWGLSDPAAAQHSLYAMREAEMRK